MVILILLLFSTSLSSDHFIRYIPGDAHSKVILSAPHGGYITPSSIPDRQNGCYENSTKLCTFSPSCGTRDDKKCKVVTSTDSYTENMTWILARELQDLIGYKPHIIISNLKRTKLDPNRPIEEAAQGNKDAEEAWNQFHGYIQTAHDLVNGIGIHFDIHGVESHSDKWLEIGYTISKTKLNAGILSPDDSSIYALSKRVNVTFEDLLYGAGSLGSMIQNNGIKVVPSPRYPSPNYSTPGGYYSGGYITQRWGSEDGGEIDAIQLENQWALRENCTRNDNCGRLSRAMGQFINTYYSASGAMRVSLISAACLFLILAS